MIYVIKINEAKTRAALPFTPGKKYHVGNGRVMDDTHKVRQWESTDAFFKWLNKFYDFSILKKLTVRGTCNNSPFEEDEMFEPASIKMHSVALFGDVFNGEEPTKCDNEKIVITHEGKSKVIVTKFLGNEEVDSVEIGCTNAGAFDFTEGAIFALQELQKKEKGPPAVYNGRVVCTSDYAEFKRGMVYDVKDGQMISAPGLSIINICSLEDLNDRFPDCKFVELIG